MCACVCARAHARTPVQSEDAVAPRISSVQREPAGEKREKWKEMNTDYEGYNQCGGFKTIKQERGEKRRGVCVCV